MSDITNRIDGVIEKGTGDYDARFVLSSTGVDRDRDTIDKEALKANAGKRLIALFAHKHDQPVGFWKNVRLEGEKLVGELKIASTNLGLMLKQLIADDVPLAASIGFVGKGGPNEAGGFHFTAIDIFECSIVSVPSNPDAMRIAKKFGVDLQSFEIAPMPTSGPSPAVVAALAKARRSRADANLLLRNSR